MKQIFLLISTILLFSCNKDTEYIPNVSVNINIYLSDPQWFNLYTAGGYEYVTGGSQGIFIYRLNQDEFVAYDRHCPFNVEQNCKVEMDTMTYITLHDNCCDNNYNLQAGNVISGSGNLPLKRYNTTFDGNLLTIRN